MAHRSETLSLRKKYFFTMAHDSKEYEVDVIPTDQLIEDLRKKGADVFTFIERKWSHTIQDTSRLWIKTMDNVALLQVTSYEDWLKSVGKKTRNMIRKAEKSGIRTEIAKPDMRLAEGIWKIYNETPIRQGRRFPHYGVSIEEVSKYIHAMQDSTYVVALTENELAGFMQIVQGDNISIISLILSLQKHWDKAVNNALIARAVRICADKGFNWLMYGRIGSHPTLDSFKKSNGFIKFDIIRFYVPLTKKGMLATKLGFHREIKAALPQSVKKILIPFYNLVSRFKIRVRHVTAK